MRRIVCFFVCGLLLSLVSCGSGEDSGDPADKSAKSPSGTPIGTTRTDPLIGLTKEKLTKYIEILNAAAADPEKDKGDVARESGWGPLDWAMFNARVKGIAEAGSFEAAMQDVRDKLKEYESQLAKFENLPADSPEGQLKMAQYGIKQLSGAVKGMQKTLDQIEALRPGGELVDSMLPEIQAALKK